jgi:hypothetical protein
VANNFDQMLQANTAALFKNSMLHYSQPVCWRQTHARISETAQGQGQGNNYWLKPCNISSNIEKHNNLLFKQHFQLSA